ncbi:Cytochrome P450 4ac2 [Carabus blaptoides fortunei]
MTRIWSADKHRNGNGFNTDSIGETKNRYFNAIHSFGKTTLERRVQPLYYTARTFNLSPLARKQFQPVKVLHQFTADVIKEREQNFNDNDFNDIDLQRKKRLAMLDLLLCAKRQRGEIDNQGIREEVDTFMFELFRRQKRFDLKENVAFSCKDVACCSGTRYNCNGTKFCTDVVGQSERRTGKKILKDI